MIGDVLFATAIQMMSDLSREDGLTISRAMAQVSLGALREPLDPLNLSREMAADRDGGRLYEKIIRLKTGILFGAACHLGAISAGADRGSVKRPFSSEYTSGRPIRLPMTWARSGCTCSTRPLRRDRRWPWPRPASTL